MSSSTVTPLHRTLIEQKMPDWMKHAPTAVHQSLRQALASPLPWLDAARRNKPQVLSHLLHEYAAHRTTEDNLKTAMRPLPTLESFAVPLLSHAIEQRFGMQLDVRRTYLFNARQAIAYKRASSNPDPFVAAQSALKQATQSLLHCALQNFGPGQAKPGGLDQDELKAVVLDSPTFSLHTPQGTPVAMSPDGFAALCRELDLGGQYQRLITDLLKPAMVANALEPAERSAMRLHAHQAYLQDLITASDHRLLLQASNGEALPAGVRCHLARLWEVELTGMLVIGEDRDVAATPVPVLVYIPDDPVCPLKRYDSTAAFAQALRERLRNADYRHFFKRLVPARHQATLLAKIEDHLSPWTRRPGQNYSERVPDPNARLHLRDAAVITRMPSQLASQKVERLTDDALFHARPTAEADSQAFAQQLAYFEQMAIGALNAAAFFVPALGAVMLGVAALQLSYEVYEGIESWAKDEKEQAFGYLMDVAENVALMTALGAIGNGAGPAAIEHIPVDTPSFIEELQSVEMPDGQLRLWKPDLAPFAHDIVLPAGLEANEFGLYDYQGKTWLALEDRTFSIEPGGTPEHYLLTHPSKAFSYAPSARHNGAGAWVLETEDPLQWQGERLTRRMGALSQGLDSQTAQRILRITDTHEAVLRRTLSEQQRLPALLEDTLWRFRLDHAMEGPENRASRFENLYARAAASDTPHTRLIRRSYPALPPRVVDELLREATATELHLLDQGNLPTRLNTEIQAYLPNLRLTRAYEGLYLDAARNLDSDRLALHMLQRLPGWPQQLCIEIRDGHATGPIIDRIGPDGAPPSLTLSHDSAGYRTYSSEGRSEAATPSFYAAIARALPHAHRAALGLDGENAGATLRQRIQQAPMMPRHQLRARLGMAPRKPGFVPPMRLADGRVGYLLSGRGATAGYILRDTLLDTLRLLHLEEYLPITAEAALGVLEASAMTREQILSRLQRLLDERQLLQAAMTQWSDASAALVDLAVRAPSRSHIADSLWRHWHTTSLPELGTLDVPLRLQQAYVTDIPAQLPGFIYERTRHLELVDLVLDAPGGIGPFDLDAIAPLRTLLGRFNRVISLEVSRLPPTHHLTPPFPGLMRVVADTLPNLQSLRLLNQRLLGGPDDFAALRGLTRLHTLDLSGNSLFWSDPAAPLAGMPLRYLGLDRVGLDRWPGWLDSQALEVIDSLSMRDNGISDLPDFLLTRTVDASHTTVISLQGNSLLPAQVQRIAMNSGTLRPRFDIATDLPPDLRHSLDQSRAELEQLREATEQWAHGSTSSEILSADTIAARATLGDTLVAFWQAFRAGQTHLPLSLVDIALEHFPRRLPGFFQRNVRNLVLTRVAATPTQLNDFLAQFRDLTELQFSGHVQPLSELPPALFDMQALEGLTLHDQGLLIDQQMLDSIGRLPALSALDLAGNRLGTIHQAPATLVHSLRRLYLSDTGLQDWPEWVNDLLPLSLLDLDGNQLTTLPDAILDNPRNLQLQTEISLLRNPLTRFTMTQAHTSEGYNRSYRFNMDLPEDIEALSPQHGWDSDTSTFGSPLHSHASSEIDELVPQAEPWMRGTVEENEANRGVWQQLENEVSSGSLLRLIQRLEQTAPFRDNRTRDGFAGRVWRVLQTAAQDPAERLLYNAMAEAALVQADGSQTCHDGALLVFNQIELRMFNEQSLQGLSGTERGTGLLRLMRRMFRLDALDAIALERLGGRDQAEVRLAYRLRLAEELDLPVPPSSMLYEATAAVRSNELGEVLAEVQRREHSAQFLDYAANNEAWIEYLRSTYPERFQDIDDRYQHQVTELPDRYPGRAIEELTDEFALLEREKRAQEQALVRELTNYLWQ